LFPLTIKYKSRIDYALDDNSKGKIIDCIKNELSLYKVDYQFLEGDRLNFHSRIFKLWTFLEPMATTEGGYFEIVKNTDHYIIICRISNYRLLILAIIFGFIVGLSSMHIFFGIIVCGLVFIIGLVFNSLLYLFFLVDLFRKIKIELFSNNNSR
jgi:hypothetical protein